MSALIGIQYCGCAIASLQEAPFAVGETGFEHPLALPRCGRDRQYRHARPSEFALVHDFGEDKTLGCGADLAVRRIELGRGQGLPCKIEARLRILHHFQRRDRVAVQGSHTVQIALRLVKSQLGLVHTGRNLGEVERREQLAAVHNIADFYVDALNDAACFEGQARVIFRAKQSADIDGALAIDLLNIGELHGNGIEARQGRLGLFFGSTTGE